MPAVRDRPHPLVIQPARPAHRGQMALLLGPDLAGAASPARPRVDGRQRMGELVRVRPDHDHLHRPFVWLTTGEADLRRTTVTWGDATLLICAGTQRQAPDPIVRVELRVDGGARSFVRVVCARAPSLISVHGPGGPGAGDMMVDGVVPLGEALRPLGLSGPSTRAADWAASNSAQRSAGGPWRLRWPGARR